jgi:hypothetical protein
MVNIKLKRFTRSKEEQPESPKQESEPQPDSPSFSPSEIQIKKSRGRPKKNKSEVTQPELKPIQEPEQLESEPQPQQLEQLEQLEPINYDDLSNHNFLDDLNNVNYKDETETKEIKIFVITDFKNEYKEFVEYIKELEKKKAGMVGFNNLFFDWPVIYAMKEHKLLLLYTI